MKFQLKALAAAAILAAALPAHAALDNGASGNGELFFNVYDTVTKSSFTFDLTPQAAYASFGTFTLNDFLPGDLDNAQGLASGVTAGEAVPGVAGFNAAGSAEADNINMNWSFTGNAAYAAFVAANPDQTNWQWNVVALDDTGTATQKNGRRYLSTVEKSVTTPFNQTSTNFTSMSTVGNYLSQVNTAAPSAADPSVFLTTSFSSNFGDGWLTRFVDSTSAVGDSASFFYLTGRSSVAINEQFENGAAFKFSADGTLNYSTATVAAVPEPETYGMLLAGLGVIGFVARRRRAI